MTIELFTAIEEPRELRTFTEATRRRLINAGYMDGNTGATRTARPGKCHGCSKPIWRGVDADWCGWTWDADPEPLGPYGEAEWLFHGGQTIELAQYGVKLNIDRRPAPQIKANPAGTQHRHDVLAAHECSRPTDHLQHAASQIPAPPDAAELPIDPPF